MTELNKRQRTFAEAYAIPELNVMAMLLSQLFMLVIKKVEQKLLEVN